jgi:hypothetical protein
MCVWSKHDGGVLIERPLWCLSTHIKYLLPLISGKFRKYDYGLEDNALLYNHSEPSEYVLDTINSPVAIFCGDSDPFTDAQVTLFINVFTAHLTKQLVV